jgi:hypothetical protein
MTDMVKTLFIAVLLLISLPAFARMYQWVDPDSKTTQLSGKPPYWYRSGDPGPRVVVFDNGRVIDDTGIELSEAENARLRQEALFAVERDRQDAMEKLARAQRQRAVFETGEEDQDIAEVDLPPVPESLPEPPPAEAAVPDNMAQQMRELLEQYEQLRTRTAREVVESAAPP